MRRPLAAVLVLVAAVSCGGDDASPTEPGGCVRVDGAYAFSLADGCGRTLASGDRTVALNQSGCAFTGVIPGYGLLDGTIAGSTLVFSITVLASSADGCGNAHLSGTGAVTEAGGRLTITGRFGTAAAPPPGCACLAAPSQGTFTLTS